MLNKLRNRAQDEKGFTLIELLVVILIIGILAAIALPAFLNQRGKAQDTEAKSAARTAQTALETLYTDDQSYSLGTPAYLRAEVEPALNEGVAATGLAITPNDQDYSITVTQVKTGSTFTITKSTAGAVLRTCTAPGKKGCPTGGKW